MGGYLFIFVDTVFGAMHITNTLVHIEEMKREIGRALLHEGGHN